MLRTEIASPRYRGLDTWDDEDILATLLDGQLNAVAAVRGALDQLQRAAAGMITRLQDERSRLFYVGAGVSGHLALQDGMEMTPTFGWPATRLVLLMAGGDAARLAPLGGCEDDAAGGVADMERHAAGPADVVVAVAASGGTAYTVGAARAACARGALVVGIANNPGTELLQVAEHPILLDTGPEVVAGSTRLGAGTAQKAALGLLSSLVMIKLGRVVDGCMVDMVVENAKLRERAVRMLITITGSERSAVLAALDCCEGQVKQAALVLAGLSRQQAQETLQQEHGRLRPALARIDPR